MSQAARKTSAADAQHPLHQSGTLRGSKLAAFLVTQDDSLWGHIGPRLEGACVLKQVDTLEELAQAAPPGQSAIVLWDARDSSDPSAGLAKLRAHSSRLSVIVLDVAANAVSWKDALVAQQVSSVLSVPVEPEILAEAITRARSAAQAHADSPVGLSLGGTGPTSPRRRGLGPVLFAAVVIAGALAGGYVWYQRSSTPPATKVSPAGSPSTGAAARTAPTSAATPPTTLKADAAHGADEQVDALLDKARQAMLDRHYIDPPEQNALAFYQNVLLYDPNNGEARQGLERIAQILYARVQSDLDEKRFDLALQALETARSIEPDDPHLKDLDVRIAQLRAELGPAQIQAAIAAKNFDRALELIEEAGRAKSLSNARLAQLRDEVHRVQASSDTARLVKLLMTRVQQDRLVEPREDSAVFYLQQARQAGATDEDLQEPTGALVRRLLADARSALDQRRAADAESLLGTARDLGTPPKTLAPLQRDLAAMRDSQARERARDSQWLEAARARITQGALLTPATDSAVYYFNQLKSADPAQPDLPSLSAALLGALLAQGRSALDAGDDARADALATAAAGIGSSADLDALKATLAQRRARASNPPSVAPTASLVPIKPLRLEYPSEALANGTEGWVDLAFTVTTEGKVTDIVVVDATPRHVFDAAAKSAVARLRYQPVVLDGRPIQVKASLHVTFRLNQK